MLDCFPKERKGEKIMFLGHLSMGFFMLLMVMILFFSIADRQMESGNDVFSGCGRRGRLSMQVI